MTLLSLCSLRSRVCHPRLYSISDFDMIIPAGWKRVILAEGPRQAINALTLYAFYLAKERDGAWYDVGKYFAGNSIVTTALTISTAFTVLMFALSLLMLLIAGLCYIPLLCYIQGNLKVCQL